MHAALPAKSRLEAAVYEHTSPMKSILLIDISQGSLITGPL
jgi:hypothetical protein